MRRLQFLLALLLTCAMSGTALAQVDRATLSGIVKDAGGAVLPGATVTVTNLATNVATTQQTTESGSYLVVNLIPGRYQLDVELVGFKKSTQPLTLEVSQRGRIDVTLELGSFEESVTVAETTQILNTNDATLGSVIPQSQVANLPLAIRNWDDLLALVPGVQGDRYTEQGGSTSFGRTGGVNVHGARSLQNNFLLDGVDNNSISTNVQELTTQVSRPSVDAIQEFKVVTSPYSAEYGRSPGAAVSVSTKSGTNNFRGTVYEYFRNESMDTIDFFSKRAGSPKPDNSQNQFGGNLGGPILKNNAFFFADYEGTRITRGVSRITNVPTADQRAGIFTSTIRDPVTGQPFPNNTIPSDRIDPYSAGIIALVPLPNQSGANNYFRNADLVDNVDRVLTRIDWRPNTIDSIFGRYMYSNRTREIPGAFGGVADGTSTSAWGNQTMKTNAFVGGWTRILSSTIVNEFRFSWSGAKSDAVQQPFGVAPPANATIPGSITDPMVAGGLPGIVIDGFFSGVRLGSPDFLPKFQRTNQYEFVNTTSWLKGDHAIKFGANIIAPMKNEYQDVPAMRGSLRFRNTFTGNAMADYLLGYVADFQLSNVWVVDQRHWATSFFIQDDWKVTDKLSVNLGLRYDFITPALEASDAQTNFNPEGAGSLVFASGGSLEERGLVKPDTNNWAPRVGVVYQLDAKTVLRGGYGKFYNLFDRVGSEDQIALNLPGLINKVYPTATAATGPVFLVRQGFPAGALNPPSLNPADGQLRSVRTRAVNIDAPKSTFTQASIGFQRELFYNVVLTADGVWTWGDDLASLVNLNQPLPSAAGAADARGATPYPLFGPFIEWRQQNGESEYKGLDLGLERRFAQGYGFGLAYTLSESNDNTAEHLSAQGSPSFPQNSRNQDDWYGPSDFDVRHRLAVNFVVEPPLGDSWIGRDWTVSGIYAWRSGRPFTVTQGGNNVGTNMNGLPNQISDDTKGPETVEKWFNTAAFQAVPSGIFGNVERNRMRGPDWMDFSMAIQRRIMFTDRMALSLRWDIFNVFNRTNFALPNANITNATTFGTISGLSGDPRIMQLSARFTF